MSERDAGFGMHRPDQGPTAEQVAELEAEMQDEVVGSWGVLSGPRALWVAVTRGAAR